MSPRLLSFVVLSWPIGEVLSIVLVASWVGALWTILALVAGAAAGLYLLRTAGRAAFSTLRAGEVRIVDLDMMQGSARLKVAGILLLVPGFMSDLGAAALLLWPRRPPRPGVRRDAAGTVVELDTGDFRREPERRIGTDSERR